MKTKYRDQTAFNTVDIGVTDGVREFLLSDFPAIDPNDAILISRAMVTESANSHVIGTPPCEATPVTYDTCFNWALNGRLLVSGTDLLNQSTLLCFSGRSGGLVMPSVVGLRSSFQVGGSSDQINLESSESFGVIERFPTRKVFLNVEMYEADPGGGKYELNVRIKYDIVTLTTSEQSDLYQLLGY